VQREAAERAARKGDQAGGCNWVGPRLERRRTTPRMGYGSWREVQTMVDGFPMGWTRSGENAGGESRCLRVEPWNGYTGTSTSLFVV
jgi:hypothetical protein